MSQTTCRADRINFPGYDESGDHADQKVNCDRECRVFSPFSSLKISEESHGIKVTNGTQKDLDDKKIGQKRNCIF